MIMKYITIAAAAVVVVILFAGFILEFLGFYKRNEKPYVDNSEFDYGHNVNHKDMNDAEILAREVMNMRSLQVEYSNLMHSRKVRKIDGEELAEAYSKMRESEKKVHAMCLDIVGIEEEE